MLFIKCNLDTVRGSYGLENTGIPEAQTLPARFPGNGNFPGISRPWFPVEHRWRGTQKGLHEVTRVSRSSCFNMFRVLRVGRRLLRRRSWIALAILLPSTTRSATSWVRLVEKGSLHPLQEKVTFSRNTI